MADMADMLKSFSSMMEGKQIPDNLTLDPFISATFNSFLCSS